MDSVFVLIEAEKLSLSDAFMKHRPCNEREHRAKELITEAIKNNVRNFYCTKFDPSFSEDKKGICFEVGKLPAVGKSFEWNKKAAEALIQDQKTRIGTRLEYGAFLGVLLKKMYENGKTSKQAWNELCTDSYKIAHYQNSKDAHHDFEPTGYRVFLGLYDLANAQKILMDDKNHNKYWIASGSYQYYSDFCPISAVNTAEYNDEILHNAVAWVVKEIE